jgi:phosphatidylinositol kinase/protein kinase (PI-3  family)
MNTCLSPLMGLVQALLVSQELIRVAILWHEMWHEGLEEASRLCFTEKNPNGMIAVLEPLHDLLEKVHLKVLRLVYRSS